MVGLLPPPFCIVDLKTSNGLIPAAGELIMLSRLLMVPGLELVMQIIGVDVCLLLLRLRGSMCCMGVIQ